LTVVDVNGARHEVTLPAETTFLEMKNYIHNSVCSSLEPKLMSLSYEGTKLTNSAKLSSVNVVVGSQLVIKQEKVSVEQISRVIADVHGIDEISE
jgi:hypothetical protein